MEENTIAAISTAFGMAAVGVVRISGERAIEIADKVFKSISGKTLSKTRGYCAHYGKIFEDNEEIDEAVALVFRAPKSYTGENVVEISCHGGIYTTKKTLQIVLKNGARPASPGEFTKRAYLNGKIDLTGAQAVMDIIKADNIQANRAAIATKNGNLYKCILKIKNELIKISAHICAYIDYPEEEIPIVETKALLNDINKVKSEIKALIDSFKIYKIIKEGIDTAIVGKPNVGKSTLMNLLSGSSRSIVTDIPGTTRDIIEESVSIGNLTLKLCDTAGIRQTNDKIEQIGVKIAKEKLNCAQLVLALFDYSDELSDEDKTMIEKLKDMPCIAIINKLDLNKKLDCDYLYKNLKYVVEISAKTGQGKKELCDIIEKYFETNKFEPSQAVLSTARQKQSAKKALDDLNLAYKELKNNNTLDAVAYLLEQAVNSLAEIDGENATDDILDEVFSKFCVGK